MEVLEQIPHRYQGPTVITEPALAYAVYLTSVPLTSQQKQLGQQAHRVD